MIVLVFDFARRFARNFSARSDGNNSALNFKPDDEQIFLAAPSRQQNKCQ
jgi:hypothetical protein